jgi:hypothetical protein
MDLLSRRAEGSAAPYSADAAAGTGIQRGISRRGGLAACGGDRPDGHSALDAGSRGGLVVWRTVWLTGWLTGLQTRDGWRIGAPSCPRQPTYARPDVHTSVRQGRRGELGTRVPAGPGRPDGRRPGAAREPESRRVAARIPSSATGPGTCPVRQGQLRRAARSESALNGFTTCVTRPCRQTAEGMS